MCRGGRWGRRWRRRWRRRRQLGWGRTLQQSGRYGREHLPSACLPACDTSSHATSWAEGLSAGHGCTQHSGLSTPHDVGFHEQSPHRIHDPLWRHPLLSCSNCGKRAKEECQFTKVRRSGGIAAGGVAADSREKPTPNQRDFQLIVWYKSSFPGGARGSKAKISTSNGHLCHSRLLAALACTS